VGCAYSRICQIINSAENNVRALIGKYGRKVMKWKEQLNGDCPRRDAHSIQERCDLICPDLPNVL
jgi:hypothetical protein